jgi:tRNA dimethylallyltransferase
MNHNIIAIVGPTASGKTALSVRLAQELGGEIVSFDSMQLYRGMDIGTATPTQEEMAGIPHHMISVADPTEAYSVSRYVNQADPIIQELLASGKPVILVGGTGLYVDSLVAGREFAPFPETGLREELMDKAEKEGIFPLYEALCLIDPEAGAAIHPSNHKRVIRAMEVYLETGKTISQHNRESREKPPKYQPLWIGLDYANREALYSRINRRVEKMFAEGLVQEVQGLLEQGIPAEATAMQAIGYKELVSHLRGETTVDEAKEAIALASRRYAKRQRTWFRRNEAVHWLELPDQPNLDEIFLSARQILRDSPK